MDKNRTLLLSKGWKRHAFILASDSEIKKTLPAFPEKIHDMLQVDGIKILIATYDCAVVNDSFESEPWLQVLIALPIQFNKQFANGRDPRRIHFNINAKEADVPYEVNARGICQIDRELLLSLQRDEECSLSETDAFDLKNWLAERYRQDTWPDAFNKAIEPAGKRLKKFWKRYNDFLSGIYIQLDTFDELEEGKYQISVIICVETTQIRNLIKHLRNKDDTLKDKDVQTVYNKLVNEIKNAFGDTVDYIEDSTSSSGFAIEVMAENAMTLEQLRHFPRFSPYSLSLYDDAPLPVEMLPGRTTE